MDDAFFTAGQALIGAGLVLMVVNAGRLLRFLSKQENAVIGNERSERVLAALVPALVMFFVPVYGFLLASNIHNTGVGLLLFAGSVFVTLVEEWIFRLIGNVKSTTLGISQALVGVFEARDPELNGHSEHVQNLSLLLFDALPAETVRGINRNELGYAALFHDIGKLGISDFILQKPGPLTDEEMALVRDHPRIGAHILAPIESFETICLWIELHHERLDGHGYYGVPGSEIPTATRIIAVCDTYSAVTMKRAYKGAHEYEYGVAILREAAEEGQLDPAIVEAFCKLPREAVLACAPDTIEIG